MGIFTSIKTATFTPSNLPDQTGKVVIVTGSTSGIGQILASILYAANARVYIAARSASKATATISSIRSEHPTSQGTLEFLSVDFNDLTTIKPATTQFLAKETRLDVLVNNAGVMATPRGSQTAQGYEMQLGVNNLGPFLFTQLLTPQLQSTAQTSPPDSVRVVWVSSSAAGNFAPKTGLVLSELDPDKFSVYDKRDEFYKYGVSKAGNILHAAELARRVSSQNVLSVSLDPGYIRTPIYDNMVWYKRMATSLILKDAVYGAYTMLFAGWSGSVTAKDNGRFIEPFGKVGATREDIEVSRRGKIEGGSGLAEEFWTWSEEQVKPFA